MARKPLFGPTGNQIGYQNDDGTIEYNDAPATNTSSDWDVPEADIGAPAPVSTPSYGGTPSAGLSPDNVWRASIQQESGGRPGVRGQPTQYGTALGMTQMLPATAREMAGKIGVAWRPDLLTGTSAEAAAYQERLGRAYFDEGLNKYGGNVEKAVMYYHGGPNENLWGPKTRAHTNAVLTRASTGGAPVQGGADDIFGDPMANRPQQQAAGRNPMDADIDGDPTLEGNANRWQAESDQFNNNKLVVNSKTGRDATQAQADTYRRLQADGSLDMNAKPGSKELPLLATDDVNVPDAGQWYVGLDGQVRQVPGEVKKDQVLGFQAGIMKPLDNAAVALEWGINKAGDVVDGWTGGRLGSDNLADDISHAFGQPTARELQAQRKQILQDKAAEGVVPGKIGQFAGEVVGTLPLALVAPQGYAGAALTGAGAGALLTDKKDLGGITGDAALGAIGGAATHGVVNKVAGALAPRFSEAQRWMRDNAVDMTPGQAMGGFAKTVEDKLTSMPIIGDVITMGRKRGYETYNRAIADEVIAPLNKSIPTGTKPGYETYKVARNAVNSAYDDILPHVTVRPDAQFATDVQDIAASQMRTIAEPQAQQFMKIFQEKVVNQMDPKVGYMTGEQFKKADSELGRLAGSYMGDLDADKRALGYAVRDVQIALRDLMERGNPNQADAIRAANLAWAGFTRLRDAAARRGTKEGVFTPAQLDAAARKLDKSRGKGTYAQGDAMMQDVADYGREIMGDTYPDSGTAGRVLLNGLAGAGLFGANAGTGGALVGAASTPGGVLGLGALGAGAGLYTKPGASLIRGMMADRPQWAQDVGNALRKSLNEGIDIPLSNLNSNLPDLTARNISGLLGGAFSEQQTRQDPAAPAPIEIDINASTHPDVIRWRRQHGLPDLPGGRRK